MDGRLSIEIDRSNFYRNKLKKETKKGKRII